MSKKSSPVRAEMRDDGDRVVVFAEGTNPDAVRDAAEAAQSAAKHQARERKSE